MIAERQFRVKEMSDYLWVVEDTERSIIYGVIDNGLDSEQGAMDWAAQLNGECWDNPWMS